MSVQEAEDAYVRAYATWQALRWGDHRQRLRAALFYWKPLCDAANALDEARKADL